MSGKPTISRPKGGPSNYVSNNPTGSDGCAVHYPMRFKYTQADWRQGDYVKRGKGIPPKRQCVVCRDRVRMSTTRPVCGLCAGSIYEFRSKGITAPQRMGTDMEIDRITRRRIQVAVVGVREFYEAALAIERKAG